MRLAEDYEQVHAINAKSVPLFQPIQTVSVENAIKSVFYALNGEDSATAFTLPLHLALTPPAPLRSPHHFLLSVLALRSVLLRR